MAQAYASGDPYLEFARMAGAVPPSATKQSHPAERSAFKVCMLVTQYGMAEHGLAAKLNKPVAFARNLLRQHRETFPAFWRWSQSQVDAAMLLGQLQTVLGEQVYYFLKLSGSTDLISKQTVALRTAIGTDLESEKPFKLE